jgi:predicted nucleotidyltransferase
MRKQENIRLSLIRKAARKIAHAFDVEKVILFGSYASKSQSNDSDIDLLVVLEPTKHLAEIRYDIHTLLRDFPFPVDIVLRTPRQIQTAKHRRDWFIQDVISNGLLLYGKETGTH